MEIVTLAYNRPDFIEIQLNSLKRWVKDFKYTVYDNCPDDSIKNECNRLGIDCVPIKIFSGDPSWCVGISLNKMWESIKSKKGIVVYLDSDMFLIGDLPNMANHDFAFIPQTRGEYTYPWTGLMLFNMDTLPEPDYLRWEVDYSLKDTDVGGRNHFYLEDFRPKVLELDMWTLIDVQKYSHNGKDCAYSVNNHKPMLELAERFNFPKPYSFDVFKSNGKEFVFHYKSASNYPSFYTPEYNKQKTLAFKLCYNI